MTVRLLFLVGLILLVLSFTILVISFLVPPQRSSAAALVTPVSTPGKAGGGPGCDAFIACQTIGSLLIDRSWPDQINMNTSDTIRVLLRTPFTSQNLVSTVATGGNYRVAEETPPPFLAVGTPLSSKEPALIIEAFGAKSQAFVSAHLVATTFDIRSVGSEEKLLDLAGVDSVEWDWNISPKALGKQVIDVDIELTWRSKENGQVVEQLPIWQSRFDINVVQPFFDRNQLSVGALASAVLGSGSIFTSIIAWGLAQISKRWDEQKVGKTTEASQHSDGTGVRPPPSTASLSNPSSSPLDSQATVVTNTPRERRESLSTSAVAPAPQLDELSQKANAYYTDLQVYSREHDPAEWATIQNNLGATLVAQARLVEGPERQNLFKQAVTAYRSALDVHTPEGTPTQWAIEQSNLGNALSALAQLAQGSEQHDLLTQAATAYQAALHIYTPEQTSAQWARARMHLARAQFMMASLENDAESRCAMLQEASQSMEDTLSFFSQEGNSVFSQQAIQLYRTIQEELQVSGCHLAAESEV